MNQAACGPHLSYIPQRLGIPFALQDDGPVVCANALHHLLAAGVHDRELCALQGQGAGSRHDDAY
jgi:hypothetical protein